MATICNKTQPDKVGAVYILGQLIIWAVGKKPTACHQVKIEHWPFRIYPPQYQIVACIEEGAICPQMLLPYQAAAVFNVSKETLEAMGGVAIVHTSGGAEKIKIVEVTLPKAKTKLLTQDTAADGPGMPFPFSAGRDLPFPFKLGKLFETGKGEDIEFLSRSDVGLHTATGYSEKFSFTEAFRNAIANLPPDTNDYPDKLTNVSVVGVGANFGGIAGLNRMYVTVVSYY